MKRKLKLFRIIGTPYTTAANNKQHAMNKWFTRDVELIDGGSSFRYGVNKPGEIEEVSTHFKPEKDIYDSDTYSEYACEMMEAFCLSLCGDDRYTREIDPNNPDDNDIEGADFMYTDKGSNMVERLHSRLYWIGEHYWPDGELDIQTHAFRED